MRLPMGDSEMFESLQNAVSIGFTLVPDGPILVRAQNSSLDPGIADSEFQRTWKNGRKTVFLAGSGLKGVLRSHFERLLRSRRRFACDPTMRPDREADKRREPRHPLTQCNPRDYRQRPDGTRPHNKLCAACFTFGSTALAGRFRFADAYPCEDAWEETNRTETRISVGIDRRSQGPGKNILFDNEVVVDGGFAVKLTGENFCLWQLGLVLQALGDLDAGFVQIGGCKSRGMGSVTLKDWVMEFRFLDQGTGTLVGAGGSSRERRAYGLDAEEPLAVRTVQGFEETRQSLFRHIRFEGVSLRQVAELLGTGPVTNYLKKGTHWNG